MHFRFHLPGWRTLFLVLLVAHFVFGGAAWAQIRTLTVTSLPYSGANVTVSPADLNGKVGGQTGLPALQFQYATGTAVTLTAPAVIGRNNFVKWKRNGVDHATTLTTTVSTTQMNTNPTMTAVYYANAGGPTNGSFESNFAGWTMSGPVFIESTQPGYTATAGVKLASFNGNISSDVVPNPDGTISQSFATTPGVLYIATFDYGATGAGTGQQRLVATATGTSKTVTKTSTGVWPAAPAWTVGTTLSFTATGTSSTLTFSDTTTNANATGADLVLDNVRVTPANVAAAPVTVNDSATVNPGMKVRIPVLLNDSGVFDPATLVIASQPATGTASIVSPGEILYTHSGVGTAPDSLTYRVSGDGGQSAPATVNISISTSPRIANSAINMPAAPPATEVQLEDAFPGVTFYEPACFASPPGDTNRLFVAEYSGKIKVIPDVTAASPTSSVVLDVYQAIAGRTPAEYFEPGVDREAGLVGLAFHPDYANNGYFYVSYLFAKASDPTVWYARLSRFTVPLAQRTQPAPVADPASELILIEQRDRNYGHNAADIHFGPDGYLYYAIGDEGNEPYLRANAQRIDMNFFSAMLRIDVDKKPGNLEPNAHPNPDAAALGFSTLNSIPRDEVSPGVFKARYSIPIDNPFVTTAQGGSWDGVFNGAQIGSGTSGAYVRSEFWAVGLRSPWRFSFDELTGEIWYGDVGQDIYEEVNTLIMAGNYGWPYRDGLHPGPDPAPPGFTSIDPVFEYVHTGQSGDPNFKGNCVIGGRVYRGSRFPQLYGTYFFGDHLSGHIWALTRPNGITTVQRVAGLTGVATFGEDPSNGDLLLSDYFNGRIMRLVTGTTTVSSDFPMTLSATRLFADLTDLTPSPGVVPYSPNLAFWSDYAVKSRWFSIPDGTSKMTWSRDDAWTYPTGQIWVKHFDMETERGNPLSSKKRVETRVLVKTATGAYGVSYRWNAAGTEATLVEDGGDSFTIDVTVGGNPYAQSWSIPSRSQCLACHTPQAGHSLSLNTRQLNQVGTMNGVTGNQLSLLSTYGYLNNTPDSPNLLPRHLRPTETSYPIEERVRSYFAVNCSYCHAGASGTAPPTWDGRHHVTLANTGLLNGASSVAPAPYKLIVPGDSLHSVALQRMGATNGFTRMPPLGSSEIDNVNVAMVTDWINQSLPTRTDYSQWRLATFGSSNSPQGDPAADPDSDGMTNQSEFLGGTLALNGGSSLRPTVSRSGPTVSLGFTIPANRSAQVETSLDLANWSLWDVPGNSGTAFPAGNVTISGPASGAKQFFRLLIRER